MVNCGLLDDDCLECLYGLCVFELCLMCVLYVCLMCAGDMCGLSVVLRGGSKSFAGAIGHIFFDIFRE